MTLVRARRLVPSIALVTLLAGCGGGEPPPNRPLPKAVDAREAALSLFQSAQIGRASLDEVGAVIRPADEDRERAALLDLLAGLRSTTAARIAADQAIDASRTAIDLEVSLAGGGTASYTVHTLRAEDGTWKVTAIHGPGASWPKAPVATGEGLTTSPPP